MTVYLDVVMVLNFLVDFLLLLSANRLCGYQIIWGRAVLGALLGGAYGGICIVPGFAFLGNMLWRVVCLLIMGFLTFGFSISGFRRTLVFLLLSMALGGIALGLGNGGFWRVLLGAAGLAALCFFGFRNCLGSSTYLPVELEYEKKHIHLTALQDTGNTLRDPVTGRPVLVVSGDAATKITGLTPTQLSNPVETLAEGFLPGLRLIPYSSIGQPAGMLLALRIPNVKIGKWKGSSLVAFAPNPLSKEGAYEALTGGMAS